MNLIITLTTAGTDTGPFNIYSNVDNYLSAFDTDIDKATLLAGFATSNVPDGTVEIRVKSVNDLCNNYGSAGTVPLEYYFEPSPGAYVVDFVENGSFAYCYGYFSGYYNGSYTVPGNLLVKINADLTVDTSFDIGEGFNFGIVYLGATIYQQTDGKLILSGFYTSFNGVSANRIIRLNTDGTRDFTFNTGTGFDNYTTKIAVEPTTGKMYVSGLYGTYNGQSSPRFIRLLADGSRDTSFVITSGFNNGSQDILINTDGTLIVLGYFSAWNDASAPKIIKLFPDGTIDNSFVLTTGFNTGNQPNYMARVPGEDNFFVAGAFTDYNGIPMVRITKLTQTGAIVPTSEFDPGTGFDGDVGKINVIWGTKLLISGASGNVGPFTTYQGVATNGGLILLNLNGSIFHTFSNPYDWAVPIGNNLYGQPSFGGPIEIIYTYTP